MRERQNVIIPVRVGEELDIETLERFLQEKIENLPTGKLEVQQFGTGHSNLTYALQIGNWQAVLRRPPLGPVAPKAHDMEREYNILSALHPVFKTAPKPFVFSNDLSIVGSPFFVMERRHGHVLDSDFPENSRPTRELGQKISEKMVDLLVELHSLDYKQTALAGMAKPEGFMQRQVDGWIGRYERAQTDDIEGVGRLTEWMLTNMPVSQEPTIIHYDFKLNNALFSEDFSEITGLFDWEMTTVGDPLADLGAAMSYWIQEGDPDLLKKGLGRAPVTVLEGFYSRQEFIKSYGEKSGRDVSDMNFYLTFAYFKLAVIIQQIYYRYKKGQTQDPRFAHFDQYVASLMKHALSTALEK
ncbi:MULTISPECIES: phosphotransferase family protein [Planococcus]|uniref:Aminoglycoside phosphotransferase n=2 Tax=Planococcus TaxID=1372 RepID=A0ABM5X0Q5_9BACL|nr:MULTISPECIES: phosphotransferase family protein [Planococcus]ALS79319.1 aminoglycoside phosphotransferase [Planococcus kocurii]AQU78712.1 phosphotransferase family protein [Planococcus faecalis]KAA0956789.1 phosphotransferase family protein [Planococcus sp. ANT_H30]MDJ0332404.1 phosphotransferase family protein [Planococcus sp. S3-L1]